MKFWFWLYSLLFSCGAGVLIFVIIRHRRTHLLDTYTHSRAYKFTRHTDRTLGVLFCFVFYFYFFRSHATLPDNTRSHLLFCRIANFCSTVVSFIFLLFFLSLQISIWIPTGNATAYIVLWSMSTGKWVRFVDTTQNTNTHTHIHTV